MEKIEGDELLRVENLADRCFFADERIKGGIRIRVGKSDGKHRKKGRKRRRTKTQRKGRTERIDIERYQFTYLLCETYLLSSLNRVFNFLYFICYNIFFYICTHIFLTAESFWIV